LLVVLPRLPLRLLRLLLLRLVLVPLPERRLDLQQQTVPVSFIGMHRSQLALFWPCGVGSRDGKDQVLEGPTFKRASCGAVKIVTLRQSQNLRRATSAGHHVKGQLSW
jgi:hypothetical protein